MCEDYTDLYCSKTVRKKVLVATKNSFLCILVPADERLSSLVYLVPYGKLVSGVYVPVLESQSSITFLHIYIHRSQKTNICNNSGKK